MQLNDQLKAASLPHGQPSIFILIHTNSYDTDVNAFEKYEDAYQCMADSYHREISALDEDYVEYDRDASFIDRKFACIQGYDSSEQWHIAEVFTQSPEMALICRRYDEMTGESDQDNYLAECHAEFRCPVSDTTVMACYNRDRGILYFAVRHMPFAEDRKYVPYETYKWCVDCGIKNVSGIEEANRILTEMDAGVSFECLKSD